MCLGWLTNDADLFKLQQRGDDITMGRTDVNYDCMLMQLDEGKEDARRSLPKSLGQQERDAELPQNPVYGAGY